MSKSRTPQRLARLKRVLSQRQKDLTLVLSNIHDPHNVSAIYRSCDAFGLSEVHLHYTTTAFPVLGRKSSASARKWLDTIRHKDAGELQEAMAERGMRLLFTGFSEKARPLREWDLTGPTAVIMGNEHGGVEEELQKLSAGELYIPMHGMIQSFNVSVAAAIILAEAARQREDAGMYAAPRYTEEEIAEKLSIWLEK